MDCDWKVFHNTVYLEEKIKLVWSHLATGCTLDVFSCASFFKQHLVSSHLHYRSVSLTHRSVPTLATFSLRVSKRPAWGARKTNVTKRQPVIFRPVTIFLLLVASLGDVFFSPTSFSSFPLRFVVLLHLEGRDRPVRAGSDTTGAAFSIKLSEVGD